MTDEARKRVAMFIVLMILTLFCSTARAEEACVAGEGKGTWRLLLGEYKLNLVGSICGLPGTSEWQAKDEDGDIIYYSGTYILYRTSKESPNRDTDTKRIKW